MNVKRATGFVREFINKHALPFELTNAPENLPHGEEEGEEVRQTPRCPTCGSIPPRVREFQFSPILYALFSIPPDDVLRAILPRTPLMTKLIDGIKSLQKEIGVLKREVRSLLD